MKPAQMKPYSNTRYLLEYLTISFGSYLALSLIIAVISGSQYRQILCADGQAAGLLFFYLWTPVARMRDMYKRDEQVKQFLKRKTYTA